MVHLEANDGAAAFYLLFVLTIFITCLTPVIVTRLLKGMHMPQNIQYQKNQKTQYNKGTFLLAATVVGAGAVCWKIQPTAHLETSGAIRVHCRHWHSHSAFLK